MKWGVICIVMTLLVSILMGVDQNLDLAKKDFIKGTEKHYSKG